MNLTKNALKFSPQKRIKIRVSYERKTQMLIVHVSDKGKGIREEEKRRLFQLFERLERTADLDTDGMGMGLKYCQKIIKNNGGSINVFSQGENKGSTFMFSMKMSLPKNKKKANRLQTIQEEKQEETQTLHHSFRSSQSLISDDMQAPCCLLNSSKVLHLELNNDRKMKEENKRLKPPP